MSELKRNASGGFDVIYKEENRERLEWFIKERNNITELKASGVEWPWTENWILRDIKINELDRRKDYGTKFILDLSEEDKKRIVQIIFIYRFSGSNVKLLNGLLKECVNDWSDIMDKGVIFYSKAYQRPNFPKGKGTGRLFMTKHAVELSRKLESHLETFSGTIKELVKFMCDEYEKIGYKRMVFHSNEIAKDLSYFYPGIEEDGDCEIGIGAKKGLQAVFGNGKHESNFNQLLKELDITPEMLENALCEFRKFLEYDNGKRPRPNNVYRPRKNISGWNEPVFKQEDNEELDSVKTV